VLYNFLSNALKFSHEGGEVVLRSKDLGAQYRLEVEDHGIGIPKDKVQRLFKEFEQLDEGFDKKYQGTGLGLSLTKKIVEILGGQVGVKTEEGKGSLFYAQLPKNPELAEEFLA
jgi:signal transduction histidine kinase